jgi:hypothetical protein
MAASRGGLARWLRLDPAARQPVAAIEEVYRAERHDFEAAVAAERETLAGLFEDASVSDDEILEQVERVIAANNALERRTAEFLVAVRPHLNSAQQQRLLRHFAEGVREGGRHRRRHGLQRDGDESGRRGGPPAGRGPGRGRGGSSRGGGGRP